MCTSSSKNILKDGIDILCGSDKDINNIISPRKNEVISLLEKYIKEIETFNKAYGLVKIKDTNELVIRHILDSLAPLGIIIRLLNSIQSGTSDSYIQKIADAGSGAGLPGIPLAIALKNKYFYLIERMRRRAGFLLSTSAVLNMDNVKAEEKELERAESSFFDLITFRAFSPLNEKLLKTLFGICKKNGVVAAFKGHRSKIDSEISCIEKHCHCCEVIAYDVPFLDEQRHLVVIRN